MTNERAVEILNLDLDILGQYGCETAEAYKMAIKALEAHPKTDTWSIKDVADTLAKHRLIVEQQPSEEDIHREREQAYTLGYEDASKKFRTEPCEDAVSRTLVHEAITASIAESENPYEMWQRIEALPPVKPKYTDEEIDNAQAVEQAYVDKMVELAVEESRREWLNSFDTSSATKCFEAVNLLKQRLEGEE